MRVYTIHLRRHGLDGDRDLVLVKEGFSWPAFFLSVLWALWHRLWLAAAVILAAHVGLSLAALAFRLDPVGQLTASLGLAAVIGYLGNDLRRRKLARRGFQLVDVAAGDDDEAALQRFLDNDPALAADLNR